jgi:hypothetical protein
MAAGTPATPAFIKIKSNDSFKLYPDPVKAASQAQESMQMK